MQRYSLDVKLFALKKKEEGIGWGKVREAIREKFGIDPPTARALQRWQKDFKTREDFKRAVMEHARKRSEGDRAQALVQVADGLLPKLLAAQDAGDDIDNTGWKWFFTILENVLGSKKFKRLISEYMIEREGKPEIPAVPFYKIGRKEEEP